MLKPVKWSSSYGSNNKPDNGKSTPSYHSPLCWFCGRTCSGFVSICSDCHHRRKKKRT